MNWLISYPRSGNTAARYLIELLTGKPSNGVCYGSPANDKDKLQKPLIHDSKSDYVINKNHSFDGVKPDDFVLFLLRDPIECVIRHNEKKRGLNIDTLCNQIDDWFSLLQQYDDHPGNKMLFYYHELVKVSFTESLMIYPDPQSKHKDHHKQKLSHQNMIDIMGHIRWSHTELYDKYLLPYGLG